MRTIEKGGKTYRIRNKRKGLIEDVKDFMWNLHLKYHHNKKRKKCQNCTQKECPKRGKLV
jgi:hypothetical protein